MPKGTLEVIAGCMSCGKSEELIRRVRREEIAKKTIIVFKPVVDNRTDGCTVASRDGKSCDCVSLVDPAEALERALGTHVVCFDEAQFFPTELAAVADELVDRGSRVIVAGLDTDFRGQPFETMALLMAKADKVTKLTAVCMRCGEPATRSQRLINGAPAPYDAPRIQVGGDELYEARCRDCHSVPR
jgi:thymidine kinase